MRRCDPGALALGRVHVIFAAVGDEISALNRSAFRLDRKVGAEHLDEAVLGLRLEDLATIWARHLDPSCGALARPPARTPFLLWHAAQRRVDVGASAGPSEFAAAVARRLPAHPRVERVDGRAAESISKSRPGREVRAATSLQKKRVNIIADYAEYVDKWNIRLIPTYLADTSLQIYSQIRLAKNGNNIWK